jgi:hypothetical protein
MMKTKTIKAWGGFSEGKLHKILIDSGWGGFGQNENPSLAVFLTRAEAKKQYQDVRRIEIKYAIEA